MNNNSIYDQTQLLIKKFLLFVLISIISFFFTAYAYEIFFVERYLILSSSSPLTGPEKAFYKKYLKALRNNQPYDTRGVWEYVDDSNKEIKDSSLLTYPWYGYYWLKTDFPGPGWSTEHIYNSGDIIKFENEVVPFTGPSLSRVVTDNEGGNYAINFTDEYGFNNPIGLYNKQPDIAIVGDSFAEGISVNSNEDTTSFIRKTYPNSINFAKAGNGPLATLGIIREYVEVVQPKQVLWLYYEGNDLVDLNKEARDSQQVGNFLLNYIDRKFTQRLFFKQNEIDNYLKEVFWQNYYYSNRSFLEGPLVRSVNQAFSKIEKMDKIRLIDRLLLKNTFKAINQTLIPKLTILYKSLPKKISQRLNKQKKESLQLKDNYNWSLFSQVFEVANQNIEAYGGELIFIYLPTFDRVKNQDQRSFTSPYGVNSETKKKVIKTIEDLNIRVIDTTSGLIQHEDPLSMYFFRQDGHFNKGGNKYLAEIILNDLN